MLWAGERMVYRDDLPSREALRKGIEQVTARDIQEAARHISQIDGPNFAPGEKYAYSNPGYELLAQSSVTTAATGSESPPERRSVLLAATNMRTSLQSTRKVAERPASE